MSIVDDQLAEVTASYPGAVAKLLPDGSALITVPDVPLPPGWNRTSTNVQFICPVGFPMSKPDCFWTDATLLLAPGSLSKNSQVQNPPPFGGEPKLWFSWHLASWDPARNTVRSYLKCIEARLGQVE